MVGARSSPMPTPAFGVRFDAPVASEWCHGIPIHRCDRLAGALFAVAPAPKAAATMAALDVAAPESRRGVIPVNRTNRAGVVLTWRPPSGLGIGRFLIEEGEDLLDRLGILDTRDDPHRTAAGQADLDVDAEDPLQALCPRRFL